MSCRIALVVALGACGHYSFESAVTRGDGGDSGGDATDGRRLDGSPILGLLVWLECEPFSGGSLADSSGQGSIATCDANAGYCPTVMAGGPRGNACVFDGVDDVVTVAPDARFQPAQFTAAVWLRLDSQAPFYSAAWLKHAAGNSEEVWGVYHFEDTQTFSRRVVAGGSSSGYAYIDLLPPVVGEWLHVAVSYDGNSFRAYRNGTLEGVFTASISDAMSELVLGAEFDAQFRASFWSGALDDARLYDHALSDAEILELAAP